VLEKISMQLLERMTRRVLNRRKRGAIDLNPDYWNSGRISEGIMDDAAFDRVSRSVHRLLSRRVILGTLAGVSLAALQKMGFAAQAKHRGHRHRHPSKRHRHHRQPKQCVLFGKPCVSNQDCCNNDFTNCEVTSSSSEKVCCFPLGVPDCVKDADCCGANTVCRDHGCTEE
jgi:hypothetical protein